MQTSSCEQSYKEAEQRRRRKKSTETGLSSSLKQTDYKKKKDLALLFMLINTVNLTLF
jgi:hypothetical protein